MTRVLRHAYAVQDAVDRDIKTWSQPAEGELPKVLDWIASCRSVGQRPTPYDYRRVARSVATHLLYQVTDHRTDGDALGSVEAIHRWTKEQRTDYFRAVAICSAHWTATAA